MNRDQVLSLARRERGHYGRPNKFITWYAGKRRLSGPWLVAPWCAMFASWVGFSAGMSKEFGEFASCPAWVKWFQKNDRWSKTARVGDLVFYDWDDDGVADHVGLVSEVGKKTIKAIEGNTRVKTTRNSVAEQSRWKSDVLGYGRVSWPKPTPPRTYTVKAGDTLSEIAKAKGVTWQALYGANKAVIGDSPSLIKPGMKLVIP